MTHVSLFTGIGGIDLAAEWAGFQTVAQVERDPYCLRVLERHWPDVPRWTDIKEFPDERWSGTADLVSGGVPCQPASAAGKRAGKADDRWLWPEAFRVIRALHPRWCLLENPLGILSLESGVVFEDLLLELEGQGYTVWPVVVPAAGAGAPHLRYRVFVVAYSRREQRGAARAESRENQSRADVHNQRCGADVAHAQERAERPGLRQSGPGGQRGRRPVNGSGADAPDTEGNARRQRDGDSQGTGDWWATEPNVGRVAYGVPHRVDRLRALGNAVSPYHVLPILQAMAEAS